MQDMGAAGITCSTSEMSAKGEHSMIIHLDRYHTPGEYEELGDPAQRESGAYAGGSGERPGKEIEAVFSKNGICMQSSLAK